MKNSTVGAAVMATALAAAVVLPAAGDASAAPASAHGFGLNVPSAVAAKPFNTSFGNALPARLRGTSVAPASSSLRKYAPTPGDQGQVGSCVTWATGYTGYGLLMNEQRIGGGPMAPMFIYSQIAQGDDEGTTAAVALPMEAKQGIDTKKDYWQGDFDYTTQPDSAERANAAHYKLSGSRDLTKGDVVANIKDAISSGLPVNIGFQVRPNFRELNSSNSYYVPDTSSDPIGGHEVTIVGYDKNGVTVENSWGTSWGDSGFFTAPWSFVTGGDVIEVHSMGKLVTS